MPAQDGMVVTQPLSKGTNILHVRSYLNERVGPQAWRELVATFPPEQAEILGSVVSIGWYPLELDVELLRRVDEVHGRGDHALLHDLGRFAAESDLSGIQRMFLRFANPAFILEKARDYWSRFYNTGYWTVERLHEHAAVATLRGCPDPNPGCCVHLGAYIVRMFELVGAKRVHFEHARCSARGHDGCVFEGEWR